MYASPAWLGFATAADKQRIEAFVRRGVRLGLYQYQADDPTPAELSANSDDNLFECILSHSHHVLNHLLPDNDEHNLRDRRHNRSLCVKADEKNFQIRQPFKDSY